MHFSLARGRCGKKNELGWSSLFLFTSRWRAILPREWLREWLRWLLKELLKELLRDLTGCGGALRNVLELWKTTEHLNMQKRNTLVLYWSCCQLCRSAKQTGNGTEDDVTLILAISSIAISSIVESARGYDSMRPNLKMQRGCMDFVLCTTSEIFRTLLCAFLVQVKLKRLGGNSLLNEILSNWSRYSRSLPNHYLFLSENGLTTFQGTLLAKEMNEEILCHSFKACVYIFPDPENRRPP